MARAADKDRKSQEMSEREAKKGVSKDERKDDAYPRTMSANDIYAQAHDKMQPFVFNQQPRASTPSGTPSAKKSKKTHEQKQATHKYNEIDRKAKIEKKKKKSPPSKKQKLDKGSKHMTAVSVESGTPDDDTPEEEFEEDPCLYNNWDDLVDTFEENDDFVGFDVEPVVVLPVKRKREEEVTHLSLDILRPQPIPPWVDTKLYYSRDANKMLNQEIADYVAYMSPSIEEQALRKMIVRRITAVVLQVYPGARVEVFGSHATGLYLPSSDIDIVVIATQARAPSCFYKVMDELKAHRVASKIEFIKAKMVDAVCGLSIDISFNMPGGLESARIIKRFIADPHIGPATKALILVLKQFLLQRHMNEVFSGGLGSYALVVMIVSFLSLHPVVQSRQIDVKQNIGTLLMEFLELHGRCLNVASVGVGLDLNSGGFFFDKRDYFSSIDRRLCVLDPQDRTNDISRGSFSYHLVRSEFARAFDKISSIVGTIYERGDNAKRMDTILGSIIVISKSVVASREINKDLYKSLGDLESINVLTMQPVHAIQQQSATQKKIERKHSRVDEMKESFVDSDGDSGMMSDAAVRAMFDEDDAQLDAAMASYKQDNAHDSDDYCYEGSGKAVEVIDLTLSDDEQGDAVSYYKL